MATPLMDGILPSGSSTFERILASQVERLLALNIPIQDLWNPIKCPVEFLPYLAWALSCDVWDADWPEHRKRTVVANCLRLHGLKGTLAGYEEYAKLVDSEVLRAIAPPGKLILSAALRDDEMAALSVRMPQIRIYTRQVRASAGRRIYLSAGHYSCLAGPRFVADSKASDRTKPNIVFAENNVETPVSVETVTEVLPGVGRALYERALLRRPRRKGVFYMGQAMRYFVTLDPTRATASFRRVDGGRAFIRYGLKPASVDPEKFMVQGKAGRAFMLGQPIRGKFIGGLQPEARVYERIVIWDPDLVPRRRSASYLGVSRFGVKPFSAELVVSIPGVRPKKSFKIGPRGFVTGFFVASDGEKYRKTLEALSTTKPVRDQILVNTITYRSPEAGTLIAAGTPFIAGRLLRS